MEKFLATLVVAIREAVASIFGFATDKTNKHDRVEDQGQKTEPPAKTVTADTHGPEESQRGTGEPPNSPKNSRIPDDAPDDEEPAPAGHWNDVWSGLRVNLPTQVISVVLAAWIAYFVSRPVSSQDVQVLLALFT